MIDAFGTIALIAMAPTVSIQIVGVMYKIRLSRTGTEIVDDSEILDIESLGQSFIEELAKASGDALDTSAILPDADEIEIIEFETEFDYLTEDDPSHITQV
jgi:hypothetical protein